MSHQLAKFKHTFLRFLGSNKFFYLICLMVAIQGLWYALSYQPIIFDEGRHIGTIQRYAGQISPFFSEQPESWDGLGETTRDPSYLYYYVMSWPLRIVSPVLSSQYSQVVFLRITSIIFCILALFVFRKAFTIAGIDKRIINTGLLFFILLPSVALFPGVAHYDNPILLLYAILIWLAIRCVQSNKVRIADLFFIAIISLLGSLVKFQFIALFMPVVAYLAWHYLHNIGVKKLPNQLVNGWKKLSLLKQVGLVGLLVISSLLFVERSITNVVVYGQIQPDCQKIMSEKRCSVGFTAQRNLELLNTKPDNFSPASPYDYTLQNLTPAMLTSQAVPISGMPSVRVLIFAVYTFFFGACLLILVNLRRIVSKRSNQLLLIATAGYALLLAIYLYLEYVKYGSVVATSGRYLYQVLPLFIVIGLTAASQIQVLKKYSIGLAIAALIMFTQGGSILTQLTNGSDQYYWKNAGVESINTPLEFAANKAIIDALR